MNDDQRLSLLDRRAAAATAALDEAVQHVPVPEPDLGAPRRNVRRFLPLAVAAGLAIIALVGAALVFDDDEQSTIAEQPGGVTRLALPDPESLGYEVIGAFDPTSAPAPPAGVDLRMTLQAPVHADEPWETTVVSWALPTELSTLDGEAVDVGGPEAALRTDGDVASVGWLDGKDVRYVRSADATADELVSLVRRAIAAGVTAGRALPGHRILHTGEYIDVYPAAGIGVTTGDLGGIAYESDGGVLVVATTAGSDARWKAASALAVDIERLTVRGRDAVRADFGEGMTEISWLEADGTLARVSSHSGEIPVDLLEELEPISDADFADLVDEYGTEGNGEVVERRVEGVGEEIEAPEPILPDGSTTIDERTPLAEVGTSFSIGVEEFSLRATLLRAPDGSVEFETSSDGSMGGSSTGQGLADASTNVVVRNDVDPGGGGAAGELIAGVIGPSAGTVEFVDTVTGETFEPISTSGPSHANIPGSDHVLFLGTIAPEHRGRAITVVTTTPAGEEIRLSAPAQR